MGLLILAAIAVILAVVLFALPGWKSSIALYLVYLVGFYLLTRRPEHDPTCVSACDAHAAGDLISNTIIGLGWMAIVVLGLVRGATLLVRR